MSGFLIFLIFVVLCAATFLIFRIYDQVPELLLRVSEQQRLLVKIHETLEEQSRRIEKQESESADDSDDAGDSDSS